MATQAEIQALTDQVSQVSQAVSNLATLVSDHLASDNLDLTGLQSAVAPLEPAVEAIAEQLAPPAPAPATDAAPVDGSGPEAPAA